MIYFTADMHLGHANIIKYCQRPFKDVFHMDRILIQNWNQRIDPNDTVYHLGDFCFSGGQEGGDNRPLFYENQLNGKIIHILGNHDSNNHLRNSIDFARIRFSKRTWHLQHLPPTEEEIYNKATYLVGHVHEKWRFRTINSITIMNVGVDVSKFLPLKLPEIIREVSFYERTQ